MFKDLIVVPVRTGIKDTKPLTVTETIVLSHTGIVLLKSSPKHVLQYLNQMWNSLLALQKNAISSENLRNL